MIERGRDFMDRFDASVGYLLASEELLGLSELGTEFVEYIDPKSDKELDDDVFRDANRLITIGTGDLIMVTGTGKTYIKRNYNPAVVMSLLGITKGDIHGNDNNLRRAEFIKARRNIKDLSEGTFIDEGEVLKTTSLVRDLSNAYKGAANYYRKKWEETVPIATNINSTPDR